MAQSTKINITDDPEKSGEIKVKETARSWDQEKEKIDGQIQKVYAEGMTKLEKPFTKPASIIWLILIFSLIFSLAASAISSFLILTSEKIEIPFLKTIDLKKYFPTREITLTTEKKVTVTQEYRIAELAKDLKPQIVKIFAAKSELKDATPLLEQIYPPQEILGLGFILTNDGWMVFAKKNLTDLQKKYVVAAENKVFPVEKIVGDSLSEIVFVKTGASNLTATKLLGRSDLSVGQQVVIFAPDGSLILNQISHSFYREIEKSEDLVYSTDRYGDFLLLNNDLPDKFLGAPIFALDKSMVGVVADKSLVRPNFHFSNIIPLVLENKKIVRPYLGISYLNLSDAIGVLDPRFKDFNYGAIIWGSPAKNSPAANAGLENGDLILKADGLPIDSQYNFTNLVQDHRPGDTIELTFIRAGVEKNIKVTLGSK